MNIFVKQRIHLSQARPGPAQPGPTYFQILGPARACFFIFF